VQQAKTSDFGLSKVLKSYFVCLASVKLMNKSMKNPFLE